jgi:hypothetical protein
MGFTAKDIITILISVASLVLSGYALWVVQFKHGRLKMTQPTLLCLKREHASMRPKIFLRTLLYTTGPRGRVIENMYLNVRQHYGAQVFDFWGHTENGKLTLGSGLFVGSAGIASDHHFNPREGLANFIYGGGPYIIEVFATSVGRGTPQKLMELSFRVSNEQAAELVQIPTRELLLFWNARTHSYDGSVKVPPSV